MGGKIDELAEKGRAAKAARAGNERAGARAEATARDRKSQHMIDAAFETSGVYVAVAVAFGVMVIAVIALRRVVPPGNNFEMITVGAPGLLGGLVLVGGMKLAKQRSRAAELTWLAHLPFELDVDHYLEALTVQRMSSVVALEIAFENPVPDGERDLVADAIEGAAPTEHRTWNGAKLEVVSPPIETYFSSSGSDTASKYNNRRVHRWLRDCVDEALLVVHEKHRIARVDLTLRRR